MAKAPAQYSYAQLEGLWIKNGGSKATAPIAAAIAEAESGGNPGATSSNPDGGTNVGLWQLDTRGKGAGHTVAELQVPTTNAQVAIKGSSNGKDWSAWQTFVDGTYKKFLSTKTTPNMNVPGSRQQASGSAGAGGNVSAQTSACLISAPKFAFVGGGCIFSKSNARALIGGLLLTSGGLASVVGLAVLIAGSFAGTKAGKTAGSALEGIGAGVALIPGAEAAGAGIAASGAGVKGVSKHVEKRRKTKKAAKFSEFQAEERQRERLGEPRVNDNLRTGRGAIRETRSETGRRRAQRMANASANGGGDRPPF